MNRYPLWKNLMVFGVVVISTIVALPNWFGDDEAVQLSRTDGMAMDAPALEKARTTLMEGGIGFLSAALDGMSVLVRVDAPADQETVRDALQKAFPDHVAALTLSPRTPAWLRALGLKPMLLGLDLRGGVLGKVTAVGEQFLTVEVSDGVTVKVQRHSISAVLPKDTIKHA